MTAAEILVIFLSVVLGLFLVLGIILVVYLIVVVKKIKSVAETAERAASHFESIAAMIGKAAAPAVVSRFVMDTLQGFMKRHK